MSKKRRERKLRQWQKRITQEPSREGKPAALTAPSPEPKPAALPKVPQDPWAWAVGLVLLGFILLLNFRPIMQNDFWMHLHIGEDILETFKVPEVDQYSAVASGREFIAHEWLSGVFLALVGGAFGPAGFTALGELVAALLVALLYFSLPKSVRSGTLLIPIGALAIYITAFRLVIRPDLFTMLLLAVWACALERWRASRNHYWLWLLVPWVMAWANLHGAFLFGVALLWLLAALILVEHVATVQRTGESQYSAADLRAVLLTAGLAAGVCLLNPRGWHLPLFSLQMATGGAFAQVRAVTEWQPTFDSESYFFQNFPYLVRAYGVWLLVLWSGLLLRLRERPLFDLAIAGVVTYLSLKQNRFIPYAAIFGFPIAMRSWHALCVRYGGAAFVAFNTGRAAKLLGMVGVVAVMSIVLKRGYPLGPESNAALGWGFGSRHPQVETAYIKDSSFSGVLYNERMPDGAYLIRELYPAVRPVMDMRLDVYGQTLCDEYDATKSSRQALSDYVYKYGVNLALVSSGGWIEGHFTRSLGFRSVFQGAERSVLVR